MLQCMSEYTNHIRSESKIVKTHYFPIILLLFIIWSYLGLLYLPSEGSVMLYHDVYVSLFNSELSDLWLAARNESQREYVHHGNP